MAIWGPEKEGAIPEGRPCASEKCGPDDDGGGRKFAFCCGAGWDIPGITGTPPIVFTGIPEPGAGWE